MKDWIHRTGADLVSVPGQFFTHARAKNGPFFCVMQNVQTDHAGIEVAIVVHCVGNPMLARPLQIQTRSLALMESGVVRKPKDNYPSFRSHAYDSLH
jgi:hypothetical protein